MLSDGVRKMSGLLSLRQASPCVQAACSSGGELLLCGAAQVSLQRCAGQGEPGDPDKV